MRGGRVAVVGGSIAGCASALAAYRGGAEEITVFERASEQLADRGVGLAMHNARYAELEARAFLDPSMPWLQLNRRCWYVRDGAEPMGRLVGTLPFPFRTYNWGPLWRELRERVPASVDFRAGAIVERLELDGPGVELTTADGGAERFDIVVGADGYRSTVRAAACPEVRPQYAGYLAWRGSFPVERLPDAGRWPVEDCVYAVFPGGHAVIYRIPDGRGGRRVNWVLYSAPPSGHGLPLDSPTSLPPGTLTDALRDRALEIADTQLAPFWGQLMHLTEPGELFVQPMYDFTAPRYASGRLVLTGDAATVARPHTGGGAVKALQDATALESALASATSWPEALAAYDAERSPVGRGMVELGRTLGLGLVQQTPDWSAMDQNALDSHWQQADGSGTFGGRRIS
ncbi:FAD-dependent monooxygenase [Streptomyces sp. ASQP_92]|uniref:FAD-dependent monooxygenase n=1 Tax=Streptomyces sp. ASQP_92 TaxID=2979116 RepID=UPI0021C170FB|nr:FAD-dependent monooxygenase [Streptomyces sp. ASQP_92]MCT9092797.1 FAD-dependent monooxygenase [Streptomyces sp. ASQP_92]